MTQQQRDSIVRKQIAEWEKSHNKLAEFNARQTTPVTVESVSRPGTVYQSLALFQR